MFISLLIRHTVTTFHWNGKLLKVCFSHLLLFQVFLIQVHTKNADNTKETLATNNSMFLRYSNVLNTHHLTIPRTLSSLRVCILFIASFNFTCFWIVAILTDFGKLPSDSNRLEILLSLTLIHFLSNKWRSCIKIRQQEALQCTRNSVIVELVAYLGHL